MGRKIIRIKKADITPKLKGEEADIVLDTNEVFHGTINAVENLNLTLKTFHAHVLTFELKNISEIIISK